MNDNLVGYLHYKFDAPGSCALEGQRGIAYNYITAGNGLWVQAENNHIRATVPIAPAIVRGLPSLAGKAPCGDTFVILHHGLIPQRFWDLALSVLLAHPQEERYVGIRWTGTAYDLYYPAQEGKAASLTYDCGQNVVFEMHSHPGMGPGFSSIDDADEQGLKIYGCVGMEDVYYNEIGKTRLILSVNLRIGVYGYFHPVKWAEVFEGGLGDVVDVNALPAESEDNDGEG